MKAWNRMTKHALILIFISTVCFFWAFYFYTSDMIHLRKEVWCTFEKYSATVEFTRRNNKCIRNNLTWREREKFTFRHWMEDEKVLPWLNDSQAPKSFGAIYFRVSNYLSNVCNMGILAAFSWSNITRQHRIASCSLYNPKPKFLYYLSSWTKLKLGSRNFSHLKAYPTWLCASI